MEQMNHFEAAILAAGVTCVYNADDWDRIAETRAEAANPGADEATFQQCAAKAKAGCPVSKLLNTTITLDAKLVG